MSKQLRSFIKWPWWKQQELKHIKSLFPLKINNYYEPFVWGWAIFFNIKAKHYLINDKSKDLINIYKSIGSDDKKDFINILENFLKIWGNLEQLVIKHKKFFLDLNIEYHNKENIDIEVINKEIKEKINKFLKNNEHYLLMEISVYLDYNIPFFIKEIEKNIFRKIKKIKEIEKRKWIIFTDKEILENMETSFKGALYNYTRFLHNRSSEHDIKHNIYIALFFIIREYSYSWMFRFNRNWDFNVPYGWNSYNRKNFRKKVEYLSNNDLVARIKNTDIFNLDFEDFLEQTKPWEQDFIFLDPPYDTEFSTYDKNTFDKEDQKRLSNYLINKCEAKWMVVIKNTEFIHELYNKEWINIRTFDKKYLVSFMNRNDRNVTHLIITNY